MPDLPRVAFLFVVDVFVFALLVMMLGGCVATPSRYQDRNGDFANHIASAAGALPADLVYGFVVEKEGERPIV